MVVGMAIKPGEPAGCFCHQEMITADTLRMVSVWKCPICGHSDDGIDPYQWADEPRKIYYDGRLP